MFANDPVIERVRSYNSSLTQQPHDIALWFRFAYFQFEKFAAANGYRGDVWLSQGNRRTFASLKSSAVLTSQLHVLLEALRQNAYNYDIITALLNVASSLYSPKDVVSFWCHVLGMPCETSPGGITNIGMLHATSSDVPSLSAEEFIKLLPDLSISASEEHSRTLAQRPGEYVSDKARICNCKLYLPYMRFLLSTFSECTLSSIRLACWSACRTCNRYRQFATWIDIIKLYVDVEWYAGYTERATGVYQALLEFLVCRPGDLGDDTAWLEALSKRYWESETRRLGDASDVVGFNDWYYSRLKQHADELDMDIIHNEPSTSTVVPSERQSSNVIEKNIEEMIEEQLKVWQQLQQTGDDDQAQPAPTPELDLEVDEEVTRHLLRDIDSLGQEIKQEPSDNAVEFLLTMTKSVNDPSVLFQLATLNGTSDLFAPLICGVRRYNEERSAALAGRKFIARSMLYNEDGQRVRDEDVIYLISRELSTSLRCPVSLMTWLVQEYKAMNSMIWPIYMDNLGPDVPPPVAPSRHLPLITSDQQTDQSADPDRVVLYDDIEHVMVSHASPMLYPSIVCGMMRRLGFTGGHLVSCIIGDSGAGWSPMTLLDGSTVVSEQCREVLGNDVQTPWNVWWRCSNDSSEKNDEASRTFYSPGYFYDGIDMEQLLDKYVNYTSNTDTSITGELVHTEHAPVPSLLVTNDDIFDCRPDVINVIFPNIYSLCRSLMKRFPTCKPLLVSYIIMSIAAGHSDQATTHIEDNIKPDVPDIMMIHCLFSLNRLTRCHDVAYDVFTKRMLDCMVQSMTSTVTSNKQSRWGKELVSSSVPTGMNDILYVQHAQVLCDFFEYLIFEYQSTDPARGIVLERSGFPTSGATPLMDMICNSMILCMEHLTLCMSMLRDRSKVISATPALMSLLSLDMMSCKTPVGLRMLKARKGYDTLASSCVSSPSPPSAAQYILRLHVLFTYITQGLSVAMTTLSSDIRAMTSSTGCTTDGRGLPIGLSGWRIQNVWRVGLQMLVKSFKSSQYPPGQAREIIASCALQYPTWRCVYAALVYVASHCAMSSSARRLLDDMCIHAYPPSPIPFLYAVRFELMSSNCISYHRIHNLLESAILASSSSVSVIHSSWNVLERFHDGDVMVSLPAWPAVWKLLLRFEQIHAIKIVKHAMRVKHHDMMKIVLPYSKDKLGIAACSDLFEIVSPACVLPHELTEYLMPVNLRQSLIRLYYRAVHAVPWCKELWLFAFQFPWNSVLREEECRDVVNVCRFERELRLHVPPPL